MAPPEAEEIKVPSEREFGVRGPGTFLDPRLPSQKEVDEHNLSHLPYRNWCPCCVAGKGKVAPHFKQSRTDGLPEFHCDYCFLSTEGSPLATVLVAKEKNTRMTLAKVVPRKGTSVKFPVRRILASQIKRIPS